MQLHRPLDALAARQHGVFSRRQALDRSVTDRMIEQRLRSGAWIRLAPGVYAVASAPATWERQVMAAVLSRHRAIVGGRSAAVIHRFDGFRRGRPELLVPSGTSSRSPIARLTRTIWFDAIDTVHVAGLPVASRPETLTQLAGKISMRQLEEILDDQLAADQLTVEDFEPIRRRVGDGRVRGASQLFSLLDARAHDAWEPPVTRLEGLLHRLVGDPRIPPAASQHPFQFDACPMIVDLYIAEWRLILEADGRRWHSRRADFERDRARDNAAAAQGLAVLRFTWQMLTRDFEGCLQTLLRTGETRS